MIVVLKTNGGLDLCFEGKILSLKGWGELNQVSDSVWQSVEKENKEMLSKMQDEGFLFVSKSKEAKTRNAKDDTLQNAKDKQEKEMKNFEDKTKAKIIKE